MSLAFFLYLLLSIDRLSFALASPQPSAQLSSYLSAQLPTCAQSCLGDFVAASFPSSICKDNGDLSCLCTKGSASGFTLGEGALRCVASACTDPQSSDFAAAYDVCAGISNSLPMTHGTLTATMASPSTITLGVGEAVSTTSAGDSISSSTSASAFISSSTFTPSNTVASSPSTTSSIFSSSSVILTKSGASLTANTFTTLLSSSTSISAPTATSSAAVPQPVLTTAKIIGITVACSVTTAFALGLLFFFFCIKKKHNPNKRHSGSSFGGDEITQTFHELPGHPPTAPTPSETANVRANVPSKAQQFLDVPGMYHDGTGCISRPNLRSPESGFITPENIIHEVSPISAASYRTTSNLLPDKPNYNLFPASAYSQQHLRSEKPTIRQVENPKLRLMPLVPPSKPIRSTSQPINTSQIALQRYSQQHNRVPSDPFKDSTGDPRELIDAPERRRGSRPRLPRIITPVSQQEQVQRESWNSPPGLVYPPPSQRDILKAAFHSTSMHQYPSQLGTISEASNSARNSARPQLPFSNSSSSSNPNVQSQPFSSVPCRPKSNRWLDTTHYRSTSDTTSIEDDGDEEEDALLPESVDPSDIQQSPESWNKSILSGIKYPVIHTSSPPPCRLSPETPTRQPPSRLQPQLTPIKVPTPTRLQPQLITVPKLSPGFKRGQGVGKGKDKELSATPIDDSQSGLLLSHGHA